MMLTFSEFLVWEKTTHDTIDFKKIYADMAEDTLAGLVLSQLVYWHMPSKQGTSKMRVNKQGKQWVAIRRYEWWESTRLEPRQVDRVLKILSAKGLIEKATWLFDGLRTLHIRIVEKKFMELWQELTANPPVNPFLEKEKSPEKADEPAKLPNGDLSTPNYETVISVLPIGDFGVTKNDTPITKTTTKKKESAPIVATSPKSEKLTAEEHTAFMEILNKQMGLGDRGKGVYDVFHQLRGTTKDKKSERYQYGELFREQPVTLAELKTYVPFYRSQVPDTSISIPTSAKGVETWFIKLRAQPTQPATATRPSLQPYVAPQEVSLEQRAENAKYMSLNKPTFNFKPPVKPIPGLEADYDEQAG